MTASTTEDPERFNLRGLVNETVSFSGLSDPGEIAEQVLKAIPEEHLEGALSHTLRAFVREVLRDQRRRNWEAEDPTQGLGPRFISPAPEVEPFDPATDLNGDQPSAPAAKPKTTRPVRSAKVAAVRAWWQQVLEARYHVGGSEWKQYGDCGPDDLLFIATERREIAARNTAEAERHERVKALLAKHKVSRVRDLPSNALGGALGGAVAA